MLYINAIINKVPIQAFVDSGAQSTVMSAACAERCGVMRLVDTRFAGTAVGVGTSKIIGRVHTAEIMIEGKFITCSLTVIESGGVEFLLGLDMLKRFNVTTRLMQCLIDLKKNVLVFQDGMIVTPFLHEG
jgi:DNA damage-inducible protein 1